MKVIRTSIMFAFTKRNDRAKRLRGNETLQVSVQEVGLALALAALDEQSIFCVRAEMAKQTTPPCGVATTRPRRGVCFNFKK